MRKLNIIGEKYSRLLVLEEVEPYINKKGVQKDRRYSCLCDCGNTTIANQKDLRNGGTKSCGCLQAKNRNQTTHGHAKRKTQEYRSWLSIKSRCVASPTYEDITVCPEWISSFEQFYLDMGPAPKGKNVSVDRIDGGKGYTKSNCRWTSSKSLQAINRGTRSDNTSGCKGVIFSRDRWVARITVKGKRITLGSFVNKEDAIKARKEAEKKYHLPMLLRGIKTWRQLLDLYQG